jgi:hypothetical protein
MPCDLAQRGSLHGFGAGAAHPSAGEVAQSATNGAQSGGVASRVSTPLEQRHRRALFRSFFAGGFECSTFRLRSGPRLDLIAATRHEELALGDYQRLQRQGLRVAREGVRWHLVAPRPGQYDFSSVAPVTGAARATGTQVLWDLCHFGWPDYLDVFKPEFISALAEYAAALANWLQTEMDGPGFFVPIN